MRRILNISILLVLLSIGLNSCDKTKDPTIYVKYSWTAGLEYNTDNIGVTNKAGVAAARDYQGPVAVGSYTYSYKLVSENTIRTGSFFLASPPVNPDGENKRKYMIGIYNNSFELTYFDE